MQAKKERSGEGSSRNISTSVEAASSPEAQIHHRKKMSAATVLEKEPSASRECTTHHPKCLIANRKKNYNRESRKIVTQNTANRNHLWAARVWDPAKTARPAVIPMFKQLKELVLKELEDHMEI